jgi:hypothetical protein
MIVFELLSFSLFDYLRETGYSGFKLSDISRWGKQILEGLLVA